MNATENLRHQAACEGSDCAIAQGLTEWFGDLAVSEETEEIARDTYGDRF